MKKSMFNLIPAMRHIFLFFALFAFVSNASAQKEGSEAKKTLEKNYDVTPNDLLDIANKFGQVHVNTWSQSKISVKIEMKAWGGNAEKAQKMLDKISIKHEKSESKIFFSTEIEESNGTNWGSQKGFEINYTVYMPENSPLNLDNKFGDVFLADFSGKLDLDVDYGKLKAGKIKSMQSAVSVSYGGAEIYRLSAGTLKIAYCGETLLKEAGSLEVDVKYSTLEIGDAESLDLDNKYSGVGIGSVGRIKGDSKYSSVKIKKLLKELDMSTQYANGFKIDEVQAGFEKISIAGGFSSFEIGFADKAEFEYDVRTSFGGFDNDLEGATDSQQTESGQSSTNIGKKGKTTQGKVVITNKYGDVKFK